MTTTAIVLIGLALAAAGRAAAWEPSAEVRKILADGKPWSEVLADGKGAGVIHGAIDIPAPPAAVWVAMTHCGPTRGFATSLKSCRVLSGDQREGSDVRERISRGTLFTAPIRDVVYTRYAAPYAISFHRVAGDLKAEDGETRLEPIDGGAGTRVVYDTRVAMNTGFPDALVRAVMRRTTPAVLMNLRRNSLLVASTRPVTVAANADAALK